MELYAEVAAEKLRPIMLGPLSAALAAGRHAGLPTQQIKTRLIESICGPDAEVQIALFAAELNVPIESARIVNRAVITKLLDELLG